MSTEFQGALGALLETESVSKAADQINLSPATSRALSRLQDVMKDPLLVDQGAGWPSPSRRGSWRACSDTLARLSALLKPQTFDPSQARDHFRIMAPDYLAQMIMPPVLGQALREAGARPADRYGKPVR